MAVAVCAAPGIAVRELHQILWPPLRGAREWKQVRRRKAHLAPFPDSDANNQANLPLDLVGWCFSVDALLPGAATPVLTPRRLRSRKLCAAVMVEAPRDYGVMVVEEARRLGIAQKTPVDTPESLTKATVAVAGTVLGLAALALRGAYRALIPQGTI